jgi:predicted MFS family arabinose efflux permease
MTSQPSVAEPDVTDRVSFRDVLAVREYAALWLAQLLSIAGDQFARVALTVLVYDRTSSAALAAVTFGLSVIPLFFGGLLLGWVADWYPRRTVMVASDALCVVLVGLMLVPGMPLAGDVALLSVITLAAGPFGAARAALNREILGPERFHMGASITLTTYQVAMVVGFAAGGLVSAAAGVRASLLIDMLSFAASGLLIRALVRYRPASRKGGTGPREKLALVLGGVRVVFGTRVAAVCTGMVLLATFYIVPEGVAVPLARELGGGSALAGVLLAAGAAGAGAGMLLNSRLVPARWRVRALPLLAIAASAILIAFALAPPLWAVLVLLVASELCSCYIATGNDLFISAIPEADHGKAFGVGNAGIILGQGLTIMVAGVAAEVLPVMDVIAIWGAAGTLAGLWLAIVWWRLPAQSPVAQ